MPWSFRQRIFRYAMKSTMNTRENLQIRLLQNLKHLSIEDTLRDERASSILGENIFKNHMSNKGLLPRIYKEVSK